MSIRVEAPGAGRNDDIEVLRAVAVALTVACHFGSLLRWQGTWSSLLTNLPLWGGVDLFFCISGFVIASSLLRQERPATLSRLAIPFWTRRVFRIWPAALLWLAIPLLGAEFLNSTGAFGRVRADLIGSSAAAAQVANFYDMICSRDTGARWPCGKAEVYWSLSLEEQFYLLFPVLLYLLRPRRLLALLTILIGIQLFIPRPAESALWLLRTDAICLGVVIALVRSEHPAWAGGGTFIRGRTATGLSLILIGMIAVLPGAAAVKINVGLLAITSAVLVMIASQNANVIIPLRGLRPILLWAGSRSFAIYLAHNPCFWVTREIFHRLTPGALLSDVFTIPFIVTSLGLIALCSEATYRLVEAPLRMLGRRIAARLEVGYGPTRTRSIEAFVKDSN